MADFRPPFFRPEDCDINLPGNIRCLSVDRANAKLEVELGNEYAIVCHFKDENERLRADLQLACREEYFAQLEEKLSLAKEALEFYADRENWDEDKFNPTCWDDGNIDLGNKAREALERLK